MAGMRRTPPAHADRAAQFKASRAQAILPRAQPSVRFASSRARDATRGPTRPRTVRFGQVWPSGIRVSPSRSRLRAARPGRSLLRQDEPTTRSCPPGRARLPCARCRVDGAEERHRHSPDQVGGACTSLSVTVRPRCVAHSAAARRRLLTLPAVHPSRAGGCRVSLRPGRER